MNLWNYLNLASNNLHGSFPTSASGSFCTLKSLYLDHNILSGTLPTSLKNCSDLIILDVGHNKFTGNVPTWIGESLSSLKILIGESMSSLKILSLRLNMFSGSIPAVLFHLSPLQILDLSNNNISGTIPMPIGNLTAMKYTHMIIKPHEYNIVDEPNIVGHVLVYTNDTVSVITEGREMSYTEILLMLTIIDLTSNELSEVILGEIGSLLGLGTLNLSFNHLSGGIPETISRLKALETLDFRETIFLVEFLRACQR